MKTSSCLKLNKDENVQFDKNLLRFKDKLWQLDVKSFVFFVKFV